MIVVNRFRAAPGEETTLRTSLEAAHAVLARQRGYVDGQVGRNVDEPDLWLLVTRWANVGSYRRALSAYEVKMEAWAFLGQALEEPSAYEVVVPGEDTNDALARGG